MQLYMYISQNIKTGNGDSSEKYIHKHTETIMNSITPKIVEFMVVSVVYIYILSRSTS